MKLTTVFLVAATLQVAARTEAQQVTISGKNLTLKSVFKSINIQTGFVAIYEERLLEQARPVTLNETGVDLRVVLDKCFSNQSLTYTIRDKSIIVKEKSEKKSDLVTEGLNPRLEPAPPPANIDVTITVLNTDNQPLEGASIIIKGSNKGIATDVNGRATLRGVDASATIIISFAGFTTQEVKLSNRGINPSALLVKLIASTNELQEVVINKGYYTEKQKYSVSNVGSVTAKDIEKQPVQNPLLAIQGRVPGVVVTQNNGLAGGGVTVRIQGQNSILKGNDPLCIIDGVPYFNQLPSTGVDGILGTSGGMVGGNSSGNPLSYINPNDVESIEVLKDADATAIYGSRAANGAILITTKKGKAGQMRLDINLQNGWGKVAHKWDMLNTRQYLDMRYEALNNDGINFITQSNTNARFYDLKLWDTTRYTDWQDVLIGGAAQYTNLAASISGGSAYMQYLISGNYHKQTTVFPGNFDDQKGSLHFSVNGNSQNQKFRVQFSGSFMQDNNHLPNIDLTKLAVQLEPVAPELYKSDGSLNWAPNVVGNSTWTNPLVNLLARYANKTNSLVSNLVLQYQILPGLYIKSSMGYTRLLTSDYRGFPLSFTRPESRATAQRVSDFGNRELSSWIVEPQLTYSKTIGKGKLDLLIGSTLQQNKSQAGNISSFGYNSDEVMENLSAATTITAGGQFITEYKYNAFFGRANFNWQDKYILNLTARRDGSSRFGPNSQFHNFGSIGAAWLLSNESFMENQNIFSFGKIRGSYGTTGSDQIEDYSFMSLYNFLGTPGLPYQSSSGIYATGIPNPYLEWEETRKFQAGIDLGFLKDRIITNITYSQNRSSNQLLGYGLPSITGVTGFVRNFPATVENVTWEFVLTGNIIRKKNIRWTASVNFTLPENKIISFPDYETSTFASGFSGVVVGEPLGIKRTAHDLGVDPTTGTYIYADKDGKPIPFTSYPSDYVVLTDLSPRYYGGFQNNVSYKGFELDFLFQFVKQLGPNYTFYNSSRFPGFFTATLSNQPVTVLNRWQKPGDVAPIAKYSSTTSYTQEDNLYTDASFVRLKNLSISYQFPTKWQQAAHLKNCKLYVQGQNLWTFTNWEGLDPETKSVSALPPLRVFTIGIQIGF